MIVIAYGHGADLWWKGVSASLARARNLRVTAIPRAESSALAALAQRSMDLQATIQDGIVWFSDAETTVEVHPASWMP